MEIILFKNKEILNELKKCVLNENYILLYKENPYLQCLLIVNEKDEELISYNVSSWYEKNELRITNCDINIKTIEECKHLTQLGVPEVLALFNSTDWKFSSGDKYLYDDILDLIDEKPDKDFTNNLIAILGQQADECMEEIDEYLSRIGELIGLYYRRFLQISMINQLDKEKNLKRNQLHKLDNLDKTFENINNYELKNILSICRENLDALKHINNSELFFDTLSTTLLAHYVLRGIKEAE